MGLLRLLPLLFVLSCAKFAYVTKQGYGQLSIEMSGVDNEEVLKDKSVPADQKEKINSIVEYKNYFYKYFEQKPSSIYSETTFLEDKAVTYLVIASKFNEIKPLKHSFPIVGEFPYLGFYSKEDAKEFQEGLDQKDYYTYLRPVFAYSTLDKLFFKDNILSSFFVYDKYELAELIFHELVHTIFFVEDSVSFNESLANYIGEEMAIEYLQLSKAENEKRVLKRKKNRELYAFLTENVKRYQSILKNKKPENKTEANVLLKDFLEKDFLVKSKKECQKLSLSNCWPLKRKWNNASFTAFLTYNKRKSFIAKLRQGRSLKGFVVYLEKLRGSFEESGEKDFVKFLKKQI